LVSRLDHRFMVKVRRGVSPEQSAREDTEKLGKPQRWLSIHNEALWTPLNY
jgi:hypothetical protein